MDGTNNKTNATACSGSRASYTVGAGSHTFRVWATDGLGNAQAAGATARTFTVDTGAPMVTLTSPAGGSSTNDTTPTFCGKAGTASGDLPAITVTVYEGDEVGGAVAKTLTTTASGGNWSVTPSTGLDPGVYTVRAQQSDNAIPPNTGSSTANTFTVDVTPPDTTITGGPAGLELERRGDLLVRLRGGRDLPVPRGRRAPTRPARRPTRSPASRRATTRADIRAVDAAGNVDPSPATRTWNVRDLHPPIAVVHRLPGLAAHRRDDHADLDLLGPRQRAREPVLGPRQRRPLQRRLRRRWWA